MKIRTVEFVTSVADPGGPVPDDLPQVGFSGRSNVGKSSLINTILRRTRKKIAHVSGQPGKTQTLNFYRVNDDFYLVDLPGFGFAKVPKKMQEQWRKLIEAYLGRPAIRRPERPGDPGGQGIRGIVHLMDARRGATELDLEMLDYLVTLGLPTLIVLTKIDKLGKQERIKRVQEVREELGLDAEQILPFSSKTGEGREALLGALDLLLEDGGGDADADGDEDRADEELAG